MPIIKRVPDFVEGKTFIIESVLVKYPSVFQPNTNYRPEWAVVIIVPQHLQQQFYEVGFRLKQDEDGNITLRARRWVRLDDGTEMRPPDVVDADGNPWDPRARGLIGNGSRCNVKVRAKYTTYQGVEGLSCYLEGLQVCDLVPFSGDGPQFGKTQGNTAGWSQQNFTAQQGNQGGQAGQPPQQNSSFAAGAFDPSSHFGGGGQQPQQAPAQQQPQWGQPVQTHNVGQQAPTNPYVPPNMQQPQQGNQGGQPQQGGGFFQGQQPQQGQPQQGALSGAWSPPEGEGGGNTSAPTNGSNPVNDMGEVPF